MVSKIRTPEILKKIGKAYSSGMSMPGICKMILEEDGIKTDTGTVSRALEIYKTRRDEIIQGDQELKKELMGTILDTKTQLLETNKLMKDIMTDAKVTKELRIAAANQILHQLEFQEKLLTRLTTSVKFQQINKITITQNVINSLETLEKEGFISILKKPKGIIDITPEEEKQEEYILDTKEEYTPEKEMESISSDKEEEPND